MEEGTKKYKPLSSMCLEDTKKMPVKPGGVLAAGYSTNKYTARITYSLQNIQKII